MDNAVLIFMMNFFLCTMNDVRITAFLIIYEEPIEWLRNSCEVFVKKFFLTAQYKCYKK